MELHHFRAAAPEAVVRRAEGDYAGAAPQPARPRVGGDAGWGEKEVTFLLSNDNGRAVDRFVEAIFFSYKLYCDCVWQKLAPQLHA